MSKTVVIIGGGPAGLTAALELCRRQNYRPIVLECEDQLGGISKTIEHHGNRMDLGGHRFFSKSDWVMDWWLEQVPLQKSVSEETLDLTYQRKSRSIRRTGSADPDTDDLVMMVRDRQSRIFFGGKFFDYPLTLSLATAWNLGLIRCVRFGISYFWAQVVPSKPADNLETFFTQRFGRELYQTFFKSYTEKVWGKPCREISAAWGAQRIKGLSITKALLNAVTRQLGIGSRRTETSLIEKFLYPKLGPGQLWDTVAQKVKNQGGEIHLEHRVCGLEYRGGKIASVKVQNTKSGTFQSIACDYVISSMPIPELLASFDQGVPEPVLKVAQQLEFRDFITVGVLLKQLSPKFAEVQDTWLYVQDPSAVVGRIQFFQRWSPYLVANADTAWIGLEYFCDEGDPLWRMTESEWMELVKKELVLLGLADPQDILDNRIVKVPKAYPAYWGGFEQFHTIREFLDPIENLFLVGRNGMHRYNNQDHSMLTALAAVQAIECGVRDKAHIWDINTEHDYHEESSQEPSKEWSWRRWLRLPETEPSAGAISP
jgi:protoporphyrinogen oxidase